MRTRVSMFLGLIIWCPSAIQQTTEEIGPKRCVIIQEKESVSVPSYIRAMSSFLDNHDKSHCQTQSIDQSLLRCGQTDVYIKPECVCTFYNVYEATLYHGYSSCPGGSGPDIVTQLKCPDCRNYSLNNTGPCINGGTLNCEGDEVAPNINCLCPPNYEGMFCENRIENVTRTCYRISKDSVKDLSNCNSTGMDCVTYSRNTTFAYKCNETHTSQGRRELQLCIDTELIPYKTEVSNDETASLTSGGISLTSVRWTVLVILGSFFVFM
uniref:Uncharacterized protein LOC111138331 n=1 Tax=Crassostrea virginica TaxID=6565 RepID=A0A8B8F2A9_CRAVI|nr:uncharacterized protein LOC111138331 [Crassostrea virginica]